MLLSLYRIQREWPAYKSLDKFIVNIKLLNMTQILILIILLGSHNESLYIIHHILCEIKKWFTQNL